MMSQQEPLWRLSRAIHMLRFHFLVVSSCSSTPLPGCDQPWEQKYLPTSALVPLFLLYTQAGYSQKKAWKSELVSLPNNPLTSQSQWN